MTATRLRIRPSISRRNNMRYGVTTAPIIRRAGRTPHRINTVVLDRRLAAAATGGRCVTATYDRDRVTGGRSVVRIRRSRSGSRRVGPAPSIGLVGGSGWLRTNHGRESSSRRHWIRLRRSDHNRLLCHGSQIYRQNTGKNQGRFHRRTSLCCSQDTLSPPFSQSCPMLPASDASRILTSFLGSLDIANHCRARPTLCNLYFTTQTPIKVSA